MFYCTWQKNFVKVIKNLAMGRIFLIINVSLIQSYKEGGRKAKVGGQVTREAQLES